MRFLNYRATQLEYNDLLGAGLKSVQVKSAHPLLEFVFPSTSHGPRHVPFQQSKMKAEKLRRFISRNRWLV